MLFNKSCLPVQWRAPCWTRTGWDGAWGSQPSGGVTRGSQPPAGRPPLSWPPPAAALAEELKHWPTWSWSGPKALYTRREAPSWSYVRPQWCWPACYRGGCPVSWSLLGSWLLGNDCLTVGLLVFWSLAAPPPPAAWVVGDSPQGMG